MTDYTPYMYVAASVGAVGSISIFVSESPSCAGLRDAKRRTFLHVAVERGQIDVASYACSSRLLSWILNMQDDEGNTDLHLAVQAGSLRMFSVLFGNRQVRLNLTNNSGETPLDISRYKIPKGMYYGQNSEPKIHDSLAIAGASNGSCRLDHFQQRYTQLTKHDEKEESDKRFDTNSSNWLSSAGNCDANDHVNGGTPTHSGRYTFHAFITANTFALIFTGIATIGLMYSGYPLFNSRSRKTYLVTALYCMETSVTCLIATFAVGLYMVLAPVAHKTAMAICVLSPIVLLSKNMEFWVNWAAYARNS
uniref:PGG domain-containing protein n=1 Tax=Oryza punctata TaxID=4537 RepID=A0A0E0LZS7_ORYPU